VLDPERRLLGVTPRAPLSLPPGGAHWYAFYRSAIPIRTTFATTYPRSSEWLDGSVSRRAHGARRVLAGRVMAYALGWRGTAAPARLIALSSFMPTVPGFELDLAPPLPPVAIGHGTYDDVIGVEWGRAARDVLTKAGADVLYRESPMGHSVDPTFLAELRTWLPL
jgi:predicted esterase